MVVLKLPKTTDKLKLQVRIPNGKAGLALLLTTLAVAGCYVAPYRTASPPELETGMTRAPGAAARIYFYPREGQGTEQQSRDHYECYLWAVKQTGFDPGNSEMPISDRVRLAPMPPPGHDTATMAIAGAVLGALIGRGRNAPAGALIGATGGALIGAASDSARLEAASRQQEAYMANHLEMQRAFTASEVNFRRAMSACLEGRGYSIR